MMEFESEPKLNYTTQQKLMLIFH